MARKPLQQKHKVSVKYSEGVVKGFLTLVEEYFKKPENIQAFEEWKAKNRV